MINEYMNQPFSDGLIHIFNRFIRVKILISNKKQKLRIIFDI